MRVLTWFQIWIIACQFNITYSASTLLFILNKYLINLFKFRFINFNFAYIKENLTLASYATTYEEDYPLIFDDFVKSKAVKKALNLKRVADSHMDEISMFDTVYPIPDFEFYSKFRKNMPSMDLFSKKIRLNVFCTVTRLFWALKNGSPTIWVPIESLWKAGPKNMGRSGMVNRRSGPSTP